MTDVVRRRLLQASIAAGVGSLLPSIARAAAIAPSVRSRTLEDLQHVVIFMQENRSFDHYFGSLAGVRGFGDRFVVPAPALPGHPQRTVWLQPSEQGDRVLTPFALDTTGQFDHMRVEGTPHSWPDAQYAWDHGRMAQWPRHKKNHAMGYFGRDDLPFQFALADAFTVCDAYHCAFQGGTNPNRLFLWSGHNDPSGRHGGPAIANSHDNFPEYGGHPDSYRWMTYVEQLQQAGVDWRIYQDMADNFTDNPLAGFERFRAAWQGQHGHDEQLRERGVSTHTLDALRADVLANRLPQVSFIIADAAGSEHPGPSSPVQGAAYTARLLDALTANPEVWSKTALLIMFDENDGFFDHMPPPAPPSPDPQRPGGWAGQSVVDTSGEYHRQRSPGNEGYERDDLFGRPYGLGPRVPMYVISPWSRGGWVDSQVYDHTSVIRLLEARFGVTASGISAWRRAVCGDLLGAFDFSQADARPFGAQLPDVRRSAARAASLSGRTTPPLPDGLTPPQQDIGVRPARALPYRPQVQLIDAAAPGQVRLQLACDGAAAVLHVYDRLQLEAVPRRYTVTPGQPVQDSWPLHNGQYDLWVLGPNGFHRHFRGTGKTALQARIERDGAQLVLQLDSRSDQALVCQVQPRTYANSARASTLSVRAGQPARLRWPAAPTAGWYDLQLDYPGGSLRLAGRVEDGQPGTSDPALGGPARLTQEA